MTPRAYLRLVMALALLGGHACADWDGLSRCFGGACDGGRNDSGVTGGFVLLPPGAALPSESSCASRVVRGGVELRPENATANQVTPTSAQLDALRDAGWSGVDARANAQVLSRVTGAFTGTTDEIIQWAACKWGLDADAVRAQAVLESNWRQGATGAISTTASQWPPGAACTDGTHCYQAYGIMQFKWLYWKSAWPMFRESTAFNLDLALAWRRACFEGWVSFLAGTAPAGGPAYAAGDYEGCVGEWSSGDWYSSGARNYIGLYNAALTARAWEKSGF